ncbi:MAG: hypothetical protein ABSG60_06190 [Terracidiphilus sp.]|jgi:hypothetical protein
MMSFMQFRVERAVAAASFFASLGIVAVPAQQLDSASIVQHIDAVIQARFENVLGFTVTEHYAVYRNNDETHPVAEMTVKTVYNKDAGKSYTILSQTGSQVIQSLVLKPLLDNEKRINQPGVREASWFTSANYEMKLKPGGTQRLDGRDCLAVAITPRRKASNLIEGTMWVDAGDFSTVQIQGTASKSPSVFTGPTQMTRQYAIVAGFAQATHASAVSNSFLFGKTVVTIDYRDYQVQLRPAK